MCLDVFARDTRVVLEGFRVLYSVVYRRVTKTVAFALRCHCARRNKLNAISNSAMIRFERVFCSYSLVIKRLVALLLVTACHRIATHPKKRRVKSPRA